MSPRASKKSPAVAVTERPGSQELVPANGDLPEFPFQLVDAYLYEATVTRTSGSTDADPRKPRFLTRLDSEDRDEKAGFFARLTVEVTFQIQSGWQCTINASTMGVFAQDGDINEFDTRRFRTADCALLLWPYARAHVGELARMTGLKLPPLPTVDVRQALSDLHLPDSP